MPRCLAVLVTLAVPIAGAAQRPDYGGRYAATSATGSPVALVLAQDGQGRITGSWSASGSTFQVSALLGDAGTALGTVSGQSGGAYFSAEFKGGQLVVTLFAVDANRQPDYQHGQMVIFTRQGSGSVGAAPTPGQAPALPLSPPAAAAPTPLRPAAPTPGGATQSFPGWNISYALPTGWQVGRSVGRLQVLASTTQAGAIFIAPGLYGNFEEMVADLGKFYQSMNLQGMPVRQPAQQTIAGLRALTATYTSQDQMGQTVHGHYVALLTPNGTGLAVLGMTTPPQMAQLAATVDRLAATVQVGPPQVNQQAVAALAGRWMFYAGRSEGVTSASGGYSHSYEEFVTFDGRGAFQWQSSAAVSASASQGMGTAGGAQANNDQGSYTVIGNTLILKGSQGQLAFELQLSGDRFTADGRTYVRSN